MGLLDGLFRGSVNAVAGYRYYIYLPEGYASEPNKWPLILFLHGMGERGDNLDSIRRNGPLRHIEDGASLPFIVLAPQCPADSWWDVGSLLALLEYAEGLWRIDNDRVYLTGLSMGGAGTWALANFCPERFAAIAPVCAFFTPGDPQRFHSLPIWCFHGAMDDFVPVSDSVRMVGSIRRCGGTARFTVYPDIAHNCWREVYSSPDLYEWFLANKRQPRLHNGTGTQNIS